MVRRFLIKTKFCISFFFCILLFLFCVLPASRGGVFAATFAGGDGSSSTPYQITSCQQLQDMNTNLSANYILNNDIDCSATNIWNEDPANLGTYFGFKPVGDWNIPFEGNLNGNNKKITSLYINRLNDSYVGLFGGIGLQTSSVEVKDLTLKDFNITGSNDVGALTGSAYSENVSNSFKVSNVHVTGESVVTGSYGIGGIVGFSNYLEMDSSSVTGTINVNSGYGGGLVGTISNEGKAGLHITTSNSTANVVCGADINYIGGLVGSVGCFGDWICKIEASYSSGNVNGYNSIGGLVGDNNATIINTYAVGNVTAASNVGSLVGVNSDGGAISNSYAAGSVTGDGSNVGGLIGVNYGASSVSSYFDCEVSSAQGCEGIFNGTPKTTAEMKTLSTFVDWDFATVPIWDLIVGNYPTFYTYIAPTPTPTPTPSTTSSSNSSNNSSSPEPKAPTCNDGKPSNSPDFFQIDVTDTTATVYYVPVSNNVSNHYISYSEKQNEFMYGTETNQSKADGVLSFTVNMLNPNTIYYVKLRGQNGCMPGEWGNVIKIKTNSTGYTTKKSFFKGVPFIETSAAVTGVQPKIAVLGAEDTQKVTVPSSAPAQTIQPAPSPSPEKKKQCLLLWCW